MKRFGFAFLLLTALGATAFLALNRPGAEASPHPIITVNSIFDNNSRDNLMTLREAMLLATGGLTLADLFHGECNRVSDTHWESTPIPGHCESNPPRPEPGADSSDTIVFDTTVFPPDFRPTISLTSALPPLDTGGDTVDASNAGVIVRGRHDVGDDFDCFTITSDSNTIKGLEVCHCNNAVKISGPLAQNNTIGGDGPGEGNVLSSNFTGVSINGADGNVVRGNRITHNLLGVHISLVHNTTVSENVISGNDMHGISIFGSEQTTVTGNFIGTDASGTAALPNAAAGVLIAYGAQDNTIGGIGSTTANVIAFNGGDGVWVDGETGTTIGNAIRRNSIHSNGGKGIENTHGGNNELAPPVVTGFDPVRGTACPNCLIDVFCDDEDEGRVMWSGSYRADAAGNWTTMPGWPDGPNVTATAVDDAGNTSEFSDPVPVPEATPTPTPSPTPTPTPTATPGPTATPTPGDTRTVTIPPGGWANFAWSGASSPQTVADCFGAGNVAVMYRLDAATQTFQRWVRGRDDLSNMTGVLRYDALLALNASAQPATCVMPDEPGGQVVTIHPGSWANFAWMGSADVPASTVNQVCYGDIAVMYRLDAATQTFQRWVRGRPDLSNMTDVQRYDALLALNNSAESATCIEI